MFKNRPKIISYSEPVAIKFGVRRPAVRAGHTPNFALAAMLATLPLHKKRKSEEGNNMRKGIIGATAAAVIFAALTAAAQAQGTDTYPDRPIKVVVPAAAGGVTDTPARIVTNRMRENLGQTFVVENQGG